MHAFVSSKKKSLWVENLFYTSSNFSFLGVLKLWLYDTSGEGIFMRSLKEGFRPKAVLEGEAESGKPNRGVAKPLYLFYGKDLSYFFVDKVPEDDLPNPTDEFSLLESRTPKSFNPLDSQLGGSRLAEGLSQSKSFIYKHSEPTIFSDKAMQLKHKGLSISQVVLGQLDFDFVKKLQNPRRSWT